VPSTLEFLLSSTKIAVDEQPIFRMMEIFLVFCQKLDYLTLALAALQDSNDPNTLAQKV
jgi:hypothetical protein